MLYTDVERAFLNCAVHVPEYDEVGMIVGITTENTNMRPDTEVDEYNGDHVRYVVDVGSTHRAIAGSEFSFLHSPPELGWTNVPRSHFGAVYLSMRHRRQWRKGLCKTRVSACLPDITYDTKGRPANVSAVRFPPGVDHGMLKHHLRLRFAAEPSALSECLRKIYDTRHTGHKTAALNTKVAFSGYRRCKNYLMWYEDQCVGWVDDNQDAPRALLLPDTADYLQVLEEIIGDVTIVEE